jgi:F0F1-type ATP synthase gamma subunit
MYNKQSLIQELSSISVLKDLVNAYEEIAANNMRKVRDVVVKKRDFLSELTGIYNEVRNTYRKELEHLRQEKKISDESLFALLKKNDKRMYVFLSTNTSLYGSIVTDTFNLLREYLAKEDADVVVVGKLGKRLFEEGFPTKQYVYFDFPDGEVDVNLLRNIVLQILPYEKVLVFHSQFETIVSQKPVAFVLSGNELEDPNTEKIHYLFEPALETILTFFEQEIFASIFEQILHESDLSKFASRMTLLDKTLENIRHDTRSLRQQQRLFRHQEFNKQQQTTLSSMRLWRK